jgi:hypothetical protein
MNECMIQKSIQKLKGEKYSTHLYVWLVRKEGSREKVCMALSVD